MLQVQIYQDCTTGPNRNSQYKFIFLNKLYENITYYILLSIYNQPTFTLKIKLLVNNNYERSK